MAHTFSTWPLFFCFQWALGSLLFKSWAEHCSYSETRGCYKLVIITCTNVIGQLTDSSRHALC